MNLNVITILLLSLYQVKGSTHWVVTEDGRIQQQLESSFAMKQPDNLVSFMRQERNHAILQDVKKKLLDEQIEIENNEDKDVQLESRHYRQDQDCRKAGKRLPDFDLFITSVLPLSQKNVQIADHVDIVKVVPYAFREPNCSKFYDLPYSIHAYDHLEGVQNRRILPPHPVAGLKTSLEFLEQPEDAATAITKALENNSTSWVLYNLAAFYWRMKGDLTEAVECIRRALHFSPESCKDIALVNLAHILHRSQYTLNATVVMHHALRLSDQLNINYFALGNMYAVIGDYNQSIYYYEQTLKFQSDFTTARKQLAAVKCQLKLQEKLENQHMSLQRTLEELQRYKVKHENFIEQQTLFSKHHLSPQTLAEQHMYFEQQRMKEGSFNHKCQFQANKSGPVLMCNLPLSHVPTLTDKEKGCIFDDLKPIPLTPITKKKTQAGDEFPPKPTTQKRPRKSKGNTTASQTKKNHREEKTEERRYNPMYDWTDPNWPPLESCQQYVQNELVWDEFPSAYVDPETRGFKVRKLLTSYIGISEGKMHELPWNKPNCVNLEALETTPYDHVIALSSAVSTFKQDNFLENFLLMHVNSGRVWPDDLGQRILSALQKALQQKDEEHIWVLYNLAGLFWRVNGDNVNAIECLRRSIYRVPIPHTDIPLVSLANIVYRFGKLNDAVHLLIYALRVNNSEPATYLSMGNALQAQGNISGAVEFYNYAMVLHPRYQEAFHSLLVVKCHNLTQTGKQKSSEEILAEWNAKNAEWAKTPDDTVTSEKESSEQLTFSQTQNVDATTSDAQHKVDDVAVKLVGEKLDASQLLEESNNIINELMNSSSDNLDEKMSTARKLMAKLAEMRKSLGHLVHEATSTLDGNRYEISCDTAMAKVDFRFTTNSSYLSSIDLDIDSSVEPDSLEPECNFSESSELNHVIDIDSITDGPEEIKHTNVLHKILKTTNLKRALRSALISDSISWKLPLVTSFFWRISGSAKKAVKCLLHSLRLATSDKRDLILYAIADYLALLSRSKEAVKAAMITEARESSAEIQYLIGNVLASEGNFSEAARHYKLATNLDQHFADAQLRYKASICRSS